MNPEALRFRRRAQCLSREHVLNLTGADSECQSTERPVRARMAVSANDGQARQRDAELGPDDVNNALAIFLVAKQRNPELSRVPREGSELLSAHR